MEPESDNSKVARRARKLREIAGELALVAAFLGSVLLAREISTGDRGSLVMNSLAAAFPIAVLSVWWVFIALKIRKLDEFERSIETRSMAIACAVTVWTTTVWGLISVFVGAPEMPLVLTAPLAAAAYGVIRTVLVFGYR